MTTGFLTLKQDSWHSLPAGFFRQSVRQIKNNHLQISDLFLWKWYRYIIHFSETRILTMFPTIQEFPEKLIMTISPHNVVRNLEGWNRVRWIRLINYWIYYLEQMCLSVPNTYVLMENLMFTTRICQGHLPLFNAIWLCKETLHLSAELPSEN